MNDDAIQNARLAALEAAVIGVHNLLVAAVGLVQRGGSIHEATDLLDDIRKSRDGFIATRDATRGHW